MSYMFFQMCNIVLNFSIMIFTIGDIEVLQCDLLMRSDVYGYVNYLFIEQYISICVSASLSPTDCFS